MAEISQQTDQYLFECATGSSDPSPNISKGKSMSYVVDLNQGSYSNGTVALDATNQINGSTWFAALRDAYITVPYVVSLKNTGAGALTATPANITQFIGALKTNTATVIDKLQVELNRKTLITPSSYLSHWNNLQAMTEWSDDDLKVHDASAMMFPDDVQLGLNISGINSLSTTSLTLNGSVVNLSYINGITAGTASASKALVMDSSSNIAGINKLSVTNNYGTAGNGTTNASVYGLSVIGSVNSNGVYASSGIALLNSSTDTMPQAAIILDRKASNQGDLLICTRSASNNVAENLRVLSTGACSINYGASPPAMISCIGSNSYTDGNYQRLLRLESYHATNPIQLEFQCNKNTGATTTNSAYIETVSNNDLQMGTNDGTQFYLKNNGYSGFGSNASATNAVLSILDGIAGTSPVSMRFGNTLSNNNCRQ